MDYKAHMIRIKKELIKKDILDKLKSEKNLKIFESLKRDNNYILELKEHYTAHCVDYTPHMIRIKKELIEKYEKKLNEDIEKFSKLLKL